MLIAWNKIDLVPSGVVLRDDAICVSAVERRGMETLLKAIANALVPRTPPAGAAVPFRARHVQLLRELMQD